MPQLDKPGSRRIGEGLLGLEILDVFSQAAKVKGLALKGSDTYGGVVTAGGSLGFRCLCQNAFWKVQLAPQCRQGIEKLGCFRPDRLVQVYGQQFDDATS